jgi:hypothetical protein
MSTLHSEDRVSLCTFTFADGRRCLTPLHSGHSHLCYFHASKEVQAHAAEQAGRDITSCLSSGRYLSACNLSIALGRLFSAVAQGHIKPKTANTLAYLGQTLLQTIRLAQHEYINAFDTDAWPSAVRLSLPRASKGLPRSSRGSPRPPSCVTPVVEQCTQIFGDGTQIFRRTHIPECLLPAYPSPGSPEPQAAIGIESPTQFRGSVLRSCLQTRQHQVAITIFRINTCKSESKQRTLTLCRINTYEKGGAGGG